MKNIFFCYILLSFALMSCQDDNPDGLRIDQVVHLYIDSSGINLLNPNLENSYSKIVFNDEYGITNTAPVSFTYGYNSDSIRYIEYIAGAKRILVDSSDGANKIYQSKIALQITKKLDEENEKFFSDTLILKYKLTPNLFQLQNAWYNNVLVFTKTGDQANIIKVTK